MRRFQRIASASLLICIASGIAEAQPGTLTAWGDLEHSGRPSGYFAQVAIALDWTAGIRTNGTLVRWGDDSQQTALPSGTFSAVAAGEWHGAALRSDGTIAMWTDHIYYGGYPDAPTDITAIGITCGEYHTVVIKDDGTLYAWGPNATSAVLTCPTGTFTQVSGGDQWTVGIRSNGTLVAWGSGNAYNQVTNCPSTGTYVKVSAGQYHGVAINSSGHLVGWGNDTWDQASCPGSSSYTYRDVSCGYTNTIAIRDDANATIDAWGLDNHGVVSDIPTSGNHWALAQGQSYLYGLVIVRGTACYANCDGSTTPPILNANDFVCFQNLYAAGDSRANCDGSTTPPVLNVNDFTCFQTAYANGCP